MIDLKLKLPSPLQKLTHPLLDEAKIELLIKRDDLIHREVSGNKWRKLVLNLKQAEQAGKQKVLTFGGAYSNHIAATAAIAARSAFEIHAMIRGEELNPNSNYCLQKAHRSGLKLHFIPREAYRVMKQVKQAEEIGQQWKDTHLIPEGGANQLGVNGCKDIYGEIKAPFDHLFCAAGTGTTAAGILSSLKHERLHVVSSIKGAKMLNDDIISWQANPEKAAQLNFIDEYHFGGYGKVTNELITFVEQCKTAWGLELDYLYTAKAFYAMTEQIKQGKFEEGSKLVFYHSGGLQANRGIMARQSQ